MSFFGPRKSSDITQFHLHAKCKFIVKISIFCKQNENDKLKTKKNLSLTKLRKNVLLLLYLTMKYIKSSHQKKLYVLKSY